MTITYYNYFSIKEPLTVRISQQSCLAFGRDRSWIYNSYVL